MYDLMPSYLLSMIHITHSAVRLCYLYRNRLPALLTTPLLRLPHSTTRVRIFLLPLAPITHLLRRRFDRYQHHSWLLHFYRFHFFHHAPHSLPL